MNSDLLDLVDAMLEWGANSESSKQVDYIQHRSLIDQQYAQFFKKRFYFVCGLDISAELALTLFQHDARNPSIDAAYQKAVAYDDKTMLFRQWQHKTSPGTVGVDVEYRQTAIPQPTVPHIAEAKCMLLPAPVSTTCPAISQRQALLPDLASKPIPLDAGSQLPRANSPQTSDASSTTRSPQRAHHQQQQQHLPQQHHYSPPHHHSPTYNFPPIDHHTPHSQLHINPAEKRASSPCGDEFTSTASESSIPSIRAGSASTDGLLPPKIHCIKRLGHSTSKAPVPDILDEGLIFAKDDGTSPFAPRTLLEHRDVQHDAQTRLRIERLVSAERPIVTTDGGNSIESQLRVLDAIEQCPADEKNNRVWTKYQTVSTEGRKQVEYRCKALGHNGKVCGRTHGTLQKARQHFVSGHVDQPCWTCPIPDCPDPRKYKRLDDLKHHHIAPVHKIDYARPRNGVAVRRKLSVTSTMPNSDNVHTIDHDQAGRSTPSKSSSSTVEKARAAHVITRFESPSEARSHLARSCSIYDLLTNLKPTAHPRQDRADYRHPPMTLPYGAQARISSTAGSPAPLPRPLPTPPSYGQHVSSWNPRFKQSLVNGRLHEALPSFEKSPPLTLMDTTRESPSRPLSPLQTRARPRKPVITSRPEDYKQSPAQGGLAGIYAAEDYIGPLRYNRVCYACFAEDTF